MRLPVARMGLRESRGRGPAGPVALAALAAWGLAAGDARAQTWWEVRVDTGASWHHQGAVDGAVRQFLGVERDAGGGEAGGSAGDPSGRILTPDDDTPYRSTRQWSLSAGLFTRRPLTPRLDIRAGARLSMGQAEYHLEKGIAPFIDPITVTIDHVALTPEMALSGRLLKRGRWHVSAETGAGVDLLRARTGISSALLDVRRTESFRDLHLFGGVEAGFGPVSATVRLRHSDRTGLQLSLGQVLRF